MVTKVNAELKSLCKRRHISFSNIYRSVFYKNKPDPSLFAPTDHLHLNFSGTALLRKKFINIIKHLNGCTRTCMVQECILTIIKYNVYACVINRQYI